MVLSQKAKLAQIGFNLFSRGRYFDIGVLMNSINNLILFQ